MAPRVAIFEAIQNVASRDVGAAVDCPLTARHDG